jgi:hypothetical protein
MTASGTGVIQGEEIASEGARDNEAKETPIVVGLRDHRNFSVVEEKPVGSGKVSVGRDEVLE